MQKIKGNDLILMCWKDEQWRAIAFSTSCEIDISVDTIETSSPKTGRWKTFKKRKKGYKITSAHLKGNVKKNPDLFTLLESDAPIKICLSTVERHPGIIKVSEYKRDGRYMLKGEALVTRLTITARKGDMVTMSIEMLGNGQLEQFWADWVFVDGKWNSSGVWNEDGIWGENLKT